VQLSAIERRNATRDIPSAVRCRPASTPRSRCGSRGCPFPSPKLVHRHRPVFPPPPPPFSPPPVWWSTTSSALQKQPRSALASADLPVALRPVLGSPGAWICLRVSGSMSRPRFRIATGRRYQAHSSGPSSLPRRAAPGLGFGCAGIASSGARLFERRQEVKYGCSLRITPPPPPHPPPPPPPPPPGATYRLARRAPYRQLQLAFSAGRVGHPRGLSARRKSDALASIISVRSLSGRIQRVRRDLVGDREPPAFPVETWLILCLCKRVWLNRPSRPHLTESRRPPISPTESPSTRRSTSPDRRRYRHSACVSPCWSRHVPAGVFRPLSCLLRIALRPGSRKREPVSPLVLRVSVSRA